MAVVTQFALFVAMLTAVIIEHGPAEKVTVAIKSILMVAAVVPLVLSLILSMHVALNELGIDVVKKAQSYISRCSMHSKEDDATTTEANSSIAQVERTPAQLACVPQREAAGLAQRVRRAQPLCLALARPGPREASSARDTVAAVRAGRGPARPTIFSSLHTVTVEVASSEQRNAGSGVTSDLRDPGCSPPAAAQEGAATLTSSASTGSCASDISQVRGVQAEISRHTRRLNARLDDEMSNGSEAAEMSDGSESVELSDGSESLEKTPGV